MKEPKILRSVFVLYVIFSQTFINGAGVTVLDGDVYVEGVISLYSNNNGMCGDEIDPEVVQNIESVRWTFSELNNDPNNLYGKKIGLRIHTTCRTEESALDVGMNLAHEMANCSGNSNGLIDSIAVIGPDFSSEAEALSRLLSSFPEKYRLLQLGYAPTSASLKDKTTFRNFFRTIPPDDIQVQVMNSLVQELDWTYVAIIYENDTYGTNGVSDLLSSIKSKDVCFPYKIAVNPSETQSSLLQILDSYLQKLMLDSNISGLLVFGSIKLGTAVMKATEILKNNTANFTVPTFLFSESSSYFEGQFRGVSKGAFAVSPPRREVQEFQDYWTNIFTNIDTLYDKSTSNKYIKLLYEATFACQLAESKQNHNCSSLTTEEVLDKLKPSLYNQYAIQAAMTVAKVARVVHLAECGTSEAICDNLFNVPRQRFIDVLNNLEITFDDDFILRPKAFKEPDIELHFTGNTDPSLASYLPAYEVYNHQECDAGSSEFCFVKVATLSDGKLAVQTGSIKDYAEDGTELTWPNIRKPQCPNYAVCELCLHEDTDEILYIPGDVYIIGIAPVHNIGSSPLQCGTIKPGGLDIVEAIRFGIVEAKSTFQSSVPSANIGVIIIDSCNDPQIIQEKVLTLQRLGVFKDGGYIPVKDKILGYIGAWSSDVSVAVAELTSRLQYVQVSFGSTAPDLSRRSLYPYFLRTPAPDSAQAKAMVDIVKELGYNLIQILYSESTYGEGGNNLILDAIKQDNNRICVAQSTSISHLANPNDVINSINNQKDAKIILMFVSSFDLEWLLPALNEAFQNQEYVYIGSEGWGTRTIVNGFTNMKGAITLTSELPVNDKFYDHLKSLTPDAGDLDPWIRQYMEYTFGCYYQWSYNKTSGVQCSGTERLTTNQDYKIDAWAPFVEKAVIALLRGADTTLKSTCGSTNSLCGSFTNNTSLFAENVKNVELKNKFGIFTRVFDSNGDGLAGYNIYVVSFSGSAIYESIGEAGTSFRFEASRWRTIHGKAINSTCGNQPVCLQCFPGEPDVPVASPTVSSGVIAVIAVLSIVCCVLAGILMWVCNRHGCCIKIENGKPKISSAYITPTYLHSRQHLPDGSENAGARRYINDNNKDMENYDVITDVGSRYRENRSFSGVGAERNHAYVREGPPSGGSLGSPSGGSLGSPSGGTLPSEHGSSGGTRTTREADINIELPEKGRGDNISPELLERGTEDYISASMT